jgi:hypothetical protein
MGIYKLGYCPVCGVQIQVQNTMGQWVAQKTNFRQADLVWEDGHHCRTIICKDCLKTDPKEVFEIIVAPNSSASSRATLDMLAKKGPPISMIEIAR